MDPLDILDIKNNRLILKTSVLNKIREANETGFILPLDSRNFAKVLKGGFCLNKKYLIYGANRTGKTQICLSLCVQAYKYFIKQEKSTKNQDFNFTYFLDSENTFRPERIKEIATAKSLDFREVLKSIKVSKIMSNSALLLKLKEIENQLTFGKNYLLIIDSINNFYRSEQGNKDSSFYNLKTAFLKILEKIDTLTKKFNLILIATAQVFPNFIEDAIINEIPVGNQFLNHFFSEYLYLSYKEEKNYVHLVNSELLPERKVIFKITSNGIADYKI
jgi:DNA repair protein RadA